MRHLVRLAVLLISILVAPLIDSATVSACKTKLLDLSTPSVDINPNGTQFTIALTNTALSANGGVISDNDYAVLIAPDTLLPGPTTPRPEPVPEAASLLAVLVSVPERASLLMFGAGLAAFSIVMKEKR